MDNGATGEREFDLNIEKILESWEVYHAVREIIANALDEQTLTDTDEIKIYKDGNAWHIVDFGRGINYHHLTQNENEEKLNSDKLIGRFGVGLKDALATLYRHGIKVRIISKYGIITLSQAPKQGFEDVITLHARILPSSDERMVGTDFVLEGCSDEDIEHAKSLFLTFSGERVLETTGYGQVVEKGGPEANIYINGVKVASEPNFLFSYNITSLTRQLKKALNRERTNVGRTAYTDRVQRILTSCKSEVVIHALIEDSRQFESGMKHDELAWNEVAMYAYKQLSILDQKTTYVTPEELRESPDIIDKMRKDGFNPVVIPTSLSQKMDDYNSGSNSGDVFNTTRNFIERQQQSYNPVIVDRASLTGAERQIFDQTDSILELIGGKPRNVKQIVIAEKIYEHEYLTETLGLWESQMNRIVVKRSQLKSMKLYAGTLLHECSHAMSGATDVSRDFEIQLTSVIGSLVERYLSRGSQDTRNNRTEVREEIRPEVKEEKPKGFLSRLRRH